MPTNRTTETTSSVARRILDFNQGRQPRLLALKFAKLRKSAFSFFRGTCHLFYQEWPAGAKVAAAPLTLITGDLHLENFGAYLGDNGRPCFDVNDFDEAVLAPASWDLVRFMTSLFIALGQADRSDARELARRCLKDYAEAAAGDDGPPDLNVDAQPGPIGDILRAFPAYPGAVCLDEFTQPTPAGRKLILDQKRFLPLTLEERAAVTRLCQDMTRWPAAANWFEVLDVARLVAGTSSLGLERYAVLVRGEGGPAGHRLLEMKECSASSLLPYLRWTQPAWPSEAERVSNGERSFQGVPRAHEGVTHDAHKSYLVRDFSRASDRINLDDRGLTAAALAPVVRSMAQLVGRGHVRAVAAAAAQGESGAAALRDYVRQHDWHDDLVKCAEHCAEQCSADYREYCAAYDRGELALG